MTKDSKKMEKHLGAFVFGLFSLILHLHTFTVDMAYAQNTEVVPVKVGLVLDMNNSVAQMGLACISIALSDFYATHEDYKTRLALHQRDSKEDVVGAAAAALDLLKNVEVEAIIGPLSSMQANFMINLGDKAQVPIIMFSDTSPSLTSIRSPYFFRAALKDSSQVEAISAVVQAFGWREVVVIYVANDFGEGIIPYLTDALEQVNTRIPYRSVIPSSATDDQIAAELYKLMTMQTRVFVVHMLTGLGSRLFTKAKELGMMSEDYAWIITDGMANELESIDPHVMESMLGVIGVKPHVPRTKELSIFEARYKNKLRKNNATSIDQDLNIFGLWAYDSAIALAMAVEKAVGTRNATFLKVNASSYSTDLESFGTSSAGAELTQALSSTTFKGLAGNFKLVDGQLQSPSYEVVNVVGPGTRVVGYWSKETGIVRELNFRNDDTSLYSTSKFNFKSIIWAGNKTYPPKGWVIPVNRKKLRVLVPVKDGFFEFLRATWNSDNSIEIQGYCSDVFDAVIKALPYGVAYEYIPFAIANHTSAGTYDELVYQVYLGNVDAVVGDVTIVANRSQYVDFTLPYTESGVSMIVPTKVNKSKNAWIFLRPLSWELWLTSLCSFVSIGVLIWILEHRINEDFRGPPWYQLGMIFWFAFSTMVFAHKERVISNLSRGVLIIWFLVVLILTQSYTASLTAMLTVQQLQPELIRNNDNVGYQNGSFVLELLKSMNFQESRLLAYNNPEELDELFLRGSKNGGIAAAYDELPYLKLFLAKRNHCSNYTLVGPIYKTDGFGFVFPRGSPLVSDISRAILNVTEGKIMSQIEKTCLGDAKQYPDPTSFSSNSLGLESFKGLFLIVGSAAALALTVFVISFLHEHWQVIYRSDPESTMWGKMVELFQRFDNRDLSSHTFRNMGKNERHDSNQCDCMKRGVEPSNVNCQLSPSTTCSLASPPTNVSPIPIFASPHLRNADDNALHNLPTVEQVEASQLMQQEIELVDPNQNEEASSTLAVSRHENH